VMTQVDLGLTGLTRLIWSLALMTVIKNLGRHTRCVEMGAEWPWRATWSP
jgi:hypothetical protein